MKTPEPAAPAEDNTSAGDSASGDTTPSDTAPSDTARSQRLAPLAVLSLSAFGLGLAPVAPGTLASLVVAAALYGLPSGPVAFVGLALFFLIAGIGATLQFANNLGAEDGDHADPGWVVSDEVAGQALASLGALPATGDWRLALLAFALFRLLDITKPGPVGAAEKRPGAVGILLDDLVAGALAGALTLAVGLTGILG